MASEKSSSLGSDKSTNKTIILIHGLWMTPLSWEHFKERFEKLGYNVMTPAWPYLGLNHQLKKKE